MIYVEAIYLGGNRCLRSGSRAGKSGPCIGDFGFCTSTGGVKCELEDCFEKEVSRI